MQLKIQFTYPKYEDSKTDHSKDIFTPDLILKHTPAAAPPPTKRKPPREKKKSSKLVKVMVW